MDLGLTQSSTTADPGLETSKRTFSSALAELFGGSSGSGGVIGGGFVGTSQPAPSRGSRSSELAGAVAGRFTLTWGGGGRQAMLSEIRLISKLRHPNITTVSSLIPKIINSTPCAARTAHSHHICILPAEKDFSLDYSSVIMSIQSKYTISFCLP